VVQSEPAAEACDTDSGLDLPAVAARAVVVVECVALRILAVVEWGADADEPQPEQQSDAAVTVAAQARIPLRYLPALRRMAIDRHLAPPARIETTSIAFGRPPAEIDRGAEPAQLPLALALGKTRLGFGVQRRCLRS